MRMEHDLFHSRFKSSVGRSSLLDIIRDSPLGENPHREAAMELVFDRTIDDCQERMFAKAKKSSQAGPVIQPNSHEKSRPTLTPVKQPATAQPSSLSGWIKSAAVQPTQTQPLRTEPDSPKMQLPQPSRVQSPNPQPQPYPELPSQPPTPRTPASRCPSTPLIDEFCDRLQAPPAPQTTTGNRKRRPNLPRTVFSPSVGGGNSECGVPMIEDKNV